MFSHSTRNPTWVLVVEPVIRFLRHTLPMLVAKSRIEVRDVCDDLELISVRADTMYSGMGGGRVAGEGSVAGVEASDVWGCVAWGVGRATGPAGTSKVGGGERVRCGRELWVGDGCLVGEGEDRTGVSLRLLLKEEDLRGRRPLEEEWGWREEERYGDREGWRGFGRDWLEGRKLMVATLYLFFLESKVWVNETLACNRGG